MNQRNGDDAPQDDDVNTVTNFRFLLKGEQFLIPMSGIVLKKGCAYGQISLIL